MHISLTVQLTDSSGCQSLSEKTHVIFLTAPPVNEEQIHEASDYVPPEKRTNESCKKYSDACLEVCRELDIKGVDLWTSIQKRKDWSTTCFTYVQFHIINYLST